MGQPKPLLPFGEWTVIEHILAVLAECPVEEVLVITGHARGAVEQRLAGWPVRPVFNPGYATGEMLSSIQVGLRSVTEGTEAALVVLGDQPAVERPILEMIVAAYRDGQGSLVAPSYDERHLCASWLAFRNG